MIELRVEPVNRGQPFDVSINGVTVPAYPGETVAGTLLATGINIFRMTHENGRERGQFCGMGVCYDCLVDIDTRQSVRACMTAVEPGMTITVPVLLKDPAK